MFAGNVSGFDGGGMGNNFDSNATLINVRFSANSSSERGGGMDNFQSSPTLINVTFNANQAWNGDAISNWESDPVLTNAIIWNNQAGDKLSPPAGQSIYNDTSTPVISHSLIAHSGGSGGG